MLVAKINRHTPPPTHPALVVAMFKSTLALLKTRLSSLRSSKKQKRTSTSAEKTPVVEPSPEVSAPPLDDDRPEVCYERKMGDSELSYYLPSRANGVNDM